MYFVHLWCRPTRSSPLPAVNERPGIVLSRTLYQIILYACKERFPRQRRSTLKGILLKPVTTLRFVETVFNYWWSIKPVLACTVRNVYRSQQCGICLYYTQSCFLGKRFRPFKYVCHTREQSVFTLVLSAKPKKEMARTAKLIGRELFLYLMMCALALRIC